MNKKYFIYIITNYTHTTLYVGITNNLVRRIEEHKDGSIPGFSKRYNLKYLVYFEEWDNVIEAIKREKRLKKWNRAWKNKLIEQINSTWKDLSFDIS